MRIKVLIVEDDDDFSGNLIEMLEALDPDVYYVLEKSRDGAIARVELELFDLLLLDLNIPTSDKALDGSPVHGHSVFARAGVVAPGTPAIVLTGSSAEEFIPSLVARAQSVDVWGGAALKTVGFVRKHKFDEFPALLKSYVAELLSLKAIELKRNDVVLKDGEERLIRIFARQTGGARVTTTQINDGLSGSKVLRLIVTNSHGVQLHDAVCKIGDPEVINDEKERYVKHVSRLAPEATPRFLAHLQFGGQRTSGVFYGLAEGFVCNAFDFLTAEKDPKKFIAQLENKLEKWSIPAERSAKAADVRRRVINDEKFAQIAGKISWASRFEALDVQIRWGITHGDLHGLNVLVSAEGNPMLIDFGDIDGGPLSTDPITLEFCLFFHPKSPLLKSDWPTLEQARMWGNLDVYLANCPVPEFIRACRDWSSRRAAGEREMACVAYAYLARQLKYPDTNHDLALALLDGVKAFADQT